MKLLAWLFGAWKATTWKLGAWESVEDKKEDSGGLLLRHAYYKAVREAERNAAEKKRKDAIAAQKEAARIQAEEAQRLIEQEQNAARIIAEMSRPVEFVAPEIAIEPETLALLDSISKRNGVNAGGTTVSAQRSVSVENITLNEQDDEALALIMILAEID